MRNKAATHFWSWVQENQKQLKQLNKFNSKVKKYYVNGLNWHINFYLPGLEYILVFPKRNNQKTQLIISANGNPEYFNTVEKVVKAAPQLTDWEFTAFIQPSKDIDDMEAGLDKPYVFNDINLKASELKFIPCEYEGTKKIDMIVYLKNFTVHCNNKNLHQVIFIMIQDIIGEKLMSQNINFVQLAQMPDQEDDELIYLYDLQYYIDDINKTN